MRQVDVDAIVVGAGPAGLIGALELALSGRTVAILEARDRAGGRAHTIHDPAFDLPVELGPEFVHGNLQPSLQLLDEAGIAYSKVSGKFMEKTESGFEENSDQIEHYQKVHRKLTQLDTDMSVRHFLDQYFNKPDDDATIHSITRYVQGYYAGDVDRTSSLAMKQEFEEADDVQYRIQGGYIGLINYLHDRCLERGVHFFFNEPVSEVYWQQGGVSVLTSDINVTARQALITIPVGVLQRSAVAFHPTPHRQLDAIGQLGFGAVIKIVVQFTRPFWKDEKFNSKLDSLSFLLSDHAIPTWWTYHPAESAMMTGWCAGPPALELSVQTDERLVELAKASLASIFGFDNQVMASMIKGIHVANWPADEWTRGGYSYDIVGGDELKRIAAEPADDTLFFAGEGLFIGIETGTVNAALRSGRDRAQAMIALSAKK